MQARIRTAVLGALLVLVAGAAAAERPVVYTTFYPTQYFAERIAGDVVEVVNPVPADADAIFWQPTRDEILAYQQADLILLNGAGFEKWVANVTLPEDRLVDTAAGFADSFIVYEDAVTHSHGDSGEHSHEGLDGHTWIDPVNARAQAATIRDALAARWPAQAGAFEAGFFALAADLDALDARLRDYAAGEAADEPLLMSHPAYNYIARRYGWNIRNLDLDPEEMPSAESFAEIAQIREHHPARFLVWEGEPLPEIAARFAAMGVESIVFGPVELLDPEDAAAGEDYLSIMRRNIDALAEIFAPDSV